MIFCQLYLQREKSTEFKTATKYEKYSNNLQCTGWDTPWSFQIADCKNSQFSAHCGLARGIPSRIRSFMHTVALQRGIPQEFAASCTPQPYNTVQCAVQCVVCSVQCTVQESGCPRTASHRFCSAGLRVHRPSGPCGSVQLRPGSPDSATALHCGRAGAVADWRVWAD